MSGTIPLVAAGADADWLTKISIFSKILTHPATFSTGTRGSLGMAKKIGTHDGKFHADEAFACAMLRMTKEFCDSPITRTRDEQVLKTMDVVVDVGGVYNPAEHRYDHHQPTFTDTFSPQHKTLLSSAGLVYKHFAREIITTKLGEVVSSESADLPSTVETIYRRLYDTFVEPFDANDNGIAPYPSSIKAAFHRSWDIFAQVSILNPEWNEHNVDVDARFEQAVSLVGSNFVAVLGRCIRSWLPARTIVLQSMNAATEGCDGECRDERLLIMEQYCPWADHLFELEKSTNAKAPLLYAIYEDSTKRSWRIHAVPREPDSFECRLALPAAWQGLRDSELDAVVGMEGCVFVHRAGFIGAHKTRQGAIKMAILAANSQ